MLEPEGMNYQGAIIRPPSEAFSILLQVTLGCSHNKCTFCGTYKDKRFSIKDEDAVETRVRNNVMTGGRVLIDHLEKAPGKAE